MRRLLPLFLLPFAFIFFQGAVPERQFFFTGFENAAEFVGKPYGAAIFGSQYKTGIALVGGIRGISKHSGDSAGLTYVYGANDTDNESKHGYVPHRGYITYCFYCDYADSGHYHGRPLQCPCFFSVWARDSGIVLHSHGHGKISDWRSHITVTSDSTVVWPRVVTDGIDSQGYAFLEHVPDQNFPTDQIHIFQASAANDPTGKLRFKENVWQRLSLYIDNRPGGYAKLWLNNFLVSWALVNGMNGTIGQSHFGGYFSAAVKSGAIFNDNIIQTECPGGETQCWNDYMATTRYDD